MMYIYLYTFIYNRKLDDQGCETALLSMASVSKMNCVRETFDEVTGEGTYVMTLSNYPIAPPFMNNIIYHDGRPTERLFSCNVSRIDHEEASSPYCRISIIEPFEGLPLYSECSNHGVCDKVSALLIVVTTLYLSLKCAYMIRWLESVLVREASKEKHVMI